MYLELVDVLRCLAPHEDAPLVAAIVRRSDRDIVDGVLGCAVCHTEYPIEQGVAIFGEGTGTSGDPTPDPLAEPADELAVRCAAMLGLYDPGGIVVLGGAWALAAADLVEMTRALAIVVEPAASVRLGSGVAALRTAGILPLAEASIRGIALDERTSVPSLVASAARALKPGGRLIASVSSAQPPGVVEVARDDRHWVAEVQAVASPPIQLGRSREVGSRRADADEGA